MKRLTLLAIFFAAYNAASAQNTFSNTGSGLNQLDMSDREEEASGPAANTSSTTVVYADPYSMEHTTMDISENTIQFNNLPKIGMIMHITDAKGNELITRKLSAKNNTANISHLKNGVHFVTLVTDNMSRRKSFMLNRN